MANKKRKTLKQIQLENEANKTEEWVLKALTKLDKMQEQIEELEARR